MWMKRSQKKEQKRRKVKNSLLSCGNGVKSVSPNFFQKKKEIKANSKKENIYFHF